MQYATSISALALILVPRGGCRRWAIEPCWEAANGEGGLAQYEVRQWTGW